MNAQQDSQQSKPPPTAMVSSTLNVPSPPGGAGSRRPKLSLQTAPQAQSVAPKTPASPAAGLVTDSPTSRNTQNNARTGLTLPHNGPSSPKTSKPTVASPKTLSPRYSPLRSPIGKSMPYSLPRGPRPILRNSPLRRVTASPSRTRSLRASTSNRRVLFRDALVELMPTPIINGSDSESDGDSDAGSTQHATPISRRKKQREWVWTIGNDSPAEGKLPRGSDDKVVYPRTPMPDEEDTSDSDDVTAASNVPLPNTPGSARHDPKSPSQVPLPVTPATPLLGTPKTPSRVPLPETPILKIPGGRIKAPPK